MRPFYADPYATLYQGDALEVLENLEPESVDLVVTSPPYFGLRRYPDTERVWGGILGCEHEWKATAGAPTKIGAQGSTETKKYASLVAQGKPLTGSVCVHCGAWHGSYGNEPLAVRLACGEKTEVREHAFS